MKPLESFEKDPERLRSGMVNWLLLSVSYAVLPYCLYVSWWVWPAMIALLSWRYFLERRGRPLPRTWVKATLVVLLVVVLFLEQQTIMGRDAGASFLIVLLGIKLLEVKRRRDFFVVSFLLYFMVVGALLFSQAILMSLYLLTVVLVVTSSLVQLQMGQDRKTSGFSHRFAWKLMGQSLPLALLLFILTPRLQGHWAFQFHQFGMGLQENMQPGDIAKLSTDEHVAFRVEFPNGDIPKSGNLYWRAFILWETRDGGWYIGRRPDPATVRRPPKEGLIVQRVTLMPHAQRWFPALDHPVLPSENIALRGGYILDSYFSLYKKWQYTATSSLSAPMMEMAPDISRLTLQKPRLINPRIQALVRGWQDQSSDPEAIVRSALKYFRDEGFQYTLEPGTYYRGDPIAEFLFERKKGFCEHFASAFTYLMRVAGIHSRLVVGYLGGEYNHYGNFMVIRQKDAHAWSEVWIPDKGWIRVDPTAALSADHIDQSLEARHALTQAEMTAQEASERVAASRSTWMPPWMQKLTWNMSLWWGMGEERWDNWMTEYDGAAQESILRRMGLKRFGWQIVIGIITLCILITMALVSAWLRKPARIMDPEMRLYHSFCSMLASAGAAPESWEGPIAFTSRAAKHFPSHAPMIEEVGRIHAHLRYGPGGPSSSSLKTLAEKIRRLRRIFRS